MSTAIAAIRMLVENDEIIKANLSEYGEGEDKGPALTFQTAQDDMEMPYVVMRIEQCKIKSIIHPLLADHVFREADRFLEIIDMYDVHLTNIQSQPRY